MTDIAVIRRFMIAAAAAVILTGCATSPAAGSGSTAVTEETAAEEAAAAETGPEETPSADASSGDPAKEAAQDNSGSDTGSSPEEEKVTVVIPTVYEDVKTQEEADEIRRRNGYDSAVLEEDGSLTIVMSRSAYDEMISQFRESVDKGISEIIAGDSDIVKIEYNDDYSVFTVTVSEDEPGLIERQAADELVMYGTLYHVYTGNDVDHITVDYVNGSGEIIETADSGSLDSAY